MKIYYLPVSSCELSTEALRESMRKWHWRQHFLALRVQDTERAKYHRKLAVSIEANPKLREIRQ